MRLFDEHAPLHSFAARNARTRLALAASPGVLASMLALQPHAVHAQAFQGTPTVIRGNIDRGFSGPTEFITVNAPVNTINWVPDDGGTGPAPINFLPSGHDVSFIGGSGLNGANYTVLNRIIAADPSRAIQLAGRVTSDAAGSIWFYAPGGLLLSSTASFDVGSLLLTANDPVGAAAGQAFITGPNQARQFRLQAAVNSTAQVNIENGAVIEANNQNSYVIAVAPRFRMDGEINVNGSAALVAASDVSFTLNGGLFDITANVSSAATGPSQVTGDITGPAGNAANADYHRIYLMTAPRNDAMTLLITGGANLGFDIAGAAMIRSNAIVLSAGYDIRQTPQGDGISVYAPQPTSDTAAAAAVNVDATNFTSNVTIRSRGTAQVVTQTGPVSAAADLAVYGDSQAIVRGLSGQSLQVTGQLVVDASNYFDAGTGMNRQAGTAEVSASGGGSVSAQLISADANGRGGSSSGTGQAGGSGTGGTALIGAFGGQVLASALEVRAFGQGGESVLGRGGSGFGGTARLQLDADGAITLNQGFVSLNASGFAPTGGDGLGSGNAVGGTAQMLVAANLAVADGVSVVADAIYFSEVPTNNLGGGFAQAGEASITVQPAVNFTTSDLLISAATQGEDGTGLNDFRGGSATLAINDLALDTFVTVNRSFLINAGAIGGPGAEGAVLKGGNATGGTASLLATGSPSLSIRAPDTRITADAMGGAGAITGQASGNGGTAVGGRAEVNFANAGSLAVSNQLTISANAMGGAGAIGGNATALDNGPANPPAAYLRYGPSGSDEDSGINVAGGVTLSATAGGGAGVDGPGGSARAGATRVLLESLTHTALSVTLNGTATGGSGSIGGGAQSGRAQVTLNEARLNVASQFLMVADAFGGEGKSEGGAGGNATVGEATLAIQGTENGLGAGLSASSLTVFARASGGSGGGGGAAGGQGGNALGSINGMASVGLLALGGFAELVGGSTSIDTSAIGGAGGNSSTGSGGAGGNAVGGVSNVGVASGPITPVINRSRANLGNVSLDGNATGGEGGAGGIGGRGGDATGGSQYVLAQGALVQAGNVLVQADAVGGSGGGGGATDAGGGNALGGKGGLLASPHAAGGNPFEVVFGGDLSVSANGVGGDSGSAPGSGRGGTAEIRLEQSATPVGFVGSAIILFASLSTDGRGGASRLAGTPSATGFGGTVLVSTGNGDLEIAEGIIANANGQAGSKLAASVLAGEARGGLIEIVTNGGSAMIGGVSADVNGFFGGSAAGSVGGTIRLAVQAGGGTLDLTGGPTSLIATGSTQNTTPNGAQSLGNASGGAVEILTAANGSLLLSLDSRQINLDAIVDGGPNGNGSNGNAIGGRLLIDNAGTTSITAPAPLAFSISAQGGNGGDSLAGGNATGGTIAIINRSGTLDVGDDGNAIQINTRAFAGASATMPGQATGGTITVTSSGGVLNFNNATTIGNDAFGGLSNSQGQPGNATGGTINLNYSGDAQLLFGGDVDLAHSVNGHIARGGDTNITGANNGIMDVTGSLRLLNDVNLNTDFDGARATGGRVSIFTNANTISSNTTTIRGNIDINVGVNILGNGIGGIATGGRLTWNAGGATTISGRVDVAASASFPDGTGGSAVGGTINIGATSGTLAMNGGLFLTANASNSGVAFGAQPTSGGRITLLSAPSAQFNVTGAVSLEANANGSDAFDGAGGAATGGEIRISNSGAMRLDIAGNNITVRATATGGTGSNSAGGTAAGGMIIIDSTATGSFALLNTGTLALDAPGVGGEGLSILGTGGSAVGGTVRVDNAGNFTLPGGLNILVNATSGDGIATGNAAGGTALLSTRGGTTTINGNAVLDGNSVVLNRAVRGNGTGGTLTVDVAAGTLDVAGNAGLTAQGSGTTGRGGTLALTANGQVLVGGNLNMTADVLTGTTVVATQSQAGEIDVAVGGGGVLDIADSFTANLGLLVSQPVFNMVARAGNFDLVSAGTTSIGGAGLTVNGSAEYTGADGQDGSAFGGALMVNVTGGSFTSAGLAMDAAADGGNNSAGNGGNAVAGSARLLIAAGATAAINGQFRLDAIANGGNGIRGGAATGGTVQLSVDGTGTIRTGSAPLLLSADATGGNGSNISGGAGTGGTVAVSAAGLLQLVNRAALSATSSGGRGGTASAPGQAGADGGAATGGTVTIRTLPGGDLNFTDLAVNVSAEAGSGGNGADGLAAPPPAELLPGQRNGSSGGNGGNGGAGGDGGSAQAGSIIIGTDAANSGGSLTITSWSLVNAAESGPGGNGGLGGAGANGGAGRNGDTVFLNGGDGGAGGNGGLGGNAGAGGNATGGLLLIGAPRNDQNGAWTLDVPLITANLGVVVGISGALGFGGAPGAGGAGGASGFNPGPPAVDGQSGQSGASGFFGADGELALSGFAAGATVQLLLFNANIAGPGEINLSADVTGVNASIGGTGGNAEAGTVELVISGGTYNLNALILSAVGTGGSSVEGSAGAGRGGSVTFRVLNGADVTLRGQQSALLLNAGGRGGDGIDDGVGGDGIGGNIFMQVDGNLTLPAGLNLLVSAAAGAGFVTGSATGGTALLSILGGTTTVNGSAVLDGNAIVPNRPFMGNGTGGTLTVDVADGTLNVASNLNFTALGSGTIGRGGTLALNADGRVLVGGNLGMAANVETNTTDAFAQSQAGVIDVNVGSAGVLGIAGSFTANLLSLVNQPVFNMTARGGNFDLVSAGTTSIGGTGLFVNGGVQYIGAGGQGGSGAGGALMVNVTGGSFASAGIAMGASTEGGGNTSGPGGNAVGGSARVLVAAGASAAINGQFRLDAIARGGNGATGGAATGGTVQLSVAGTATINPGAAQSLLSTNATGGNGSTLGGGAGTGGTVLLESLGPSGSLTITGSGAASLLLTANGTGGSGFGINVGGTGTGGTTRVVNENRLVLPGSLDLQSSGVGGGGSRRGNGIGGSARLLVSGTGDTLALSSLNLAAVGAGENGTGGLAEIRFTPDGNGNGGGIAVASGVLLNAGGQFNSGAPSGSGSSIGGNARISNTRGLLTVGSTLTLNASATDQSNGTNSSAAAGNAELLIASGQITVTGQAVLDVTARASQSFNADGGNAAGGVARLNVNANNETLPGSFTSAGLTVDATATAGSTTTEGLPAGTAFAGGRATGAQVTITGSAATAAMNTGDISIAANTAGGAGSRGLGLGGNGGAATGGSILIGMISGPGAGQGQFTGGILVSANAVAGQGGDGDGAGGVGGVGGGAGTGRIELLNDGGLFTTEAVLNASATGGGGGNGAAGLSNGGAGNAGIILVRSRPNASTGAAGSLTLASLTANAGATGGLGGSSSSARGGTVQIQAVRQTARPGDTDTGTITITNTTTLDASALGGSGGGSASSGGIALQAEAGRLIFGGAVSGTAQLFGGDSGFTGGQANGSSLSIIASAAGLIQIDSGGTFSVSANGGGGLVAGGAGFGGSININATSGGDILSTAGQFALFNPGTGGGSSTGFGGDGRGGTANITTSGAGSSIALTGARVSATGRGGSTTAGTGGEGRGGTLFVGVSNSAVLTAGQSLSLEADGIGGGGFRGGRGFGGLATISATTLGRLLGGADLAVLRADGRGGAASGETGGDGEAGTASILADTAAEIVLGTIGSVSAAGFGGSSSADGGTGRGGTTRIEARGGSRITAGSVGNIDASGTGGEGFGTREGGFGRGGDNTLSAQSGGQIAFTSTDVTRGIQLSAGGVGGDSFLGQGGDTIAGRIFVRAEGGGAQIRLDASNAIGNRNALGIILNTQGFGGQGDLAVTPGASNAAGGDAFGGPISISASGNAAISLVGPAAITSNAQGGRGTGGGDAGAGEVFIELRNAVDTTRFSAGDLTITAISQGGIASGTGSGGDASGRGTGSNVNGSTGGVFLGGSGNQGNFTAGIVQIDASANGGRGGSNGLNGTGGGGGDSADVVIGLGSGNSAGTTPGILSLGRTLLDAGGNGGNGGSGLTGGTAGAGGNGSGGDVRVQAFGSSVSLGISDNSQVTLVTAGGGGTGGIFLGTGSTGGTGRGGNVLVEAKPGSGGAAGSIGLGLLLADSRGVGGAADGNDGGTGGFGGGGRIDLLASGGTITASAVRDFFTFGEGGFGSQAGGNGTGGIINLAATAAGTLQMGGFTAHASGTGGRSAVAGGDGRGGSVGVRADGGTITVTATAAPTGTGIGLYARGEGGDGAFTGPGGIGPGGDGVGGIIDVQATPNGVLTLNGFAGTDRSIDISASGTGSSGTVGGSGTGGVVRVFTDGAASLILTGDAGIAANGSGGFGEDGLGGGGFAGRVAVSLENAVIGSSITTGNLTLSANSVGGDADDFAGGNADGTINLAGTGLFLGSTSNRGSLTTGEVNLFANATGGTSGRINSLDGADGGNARAGDVFVGTQALAPGGSGGSFTLGRLSIEAMASGGNGSDGDLADGSGGNSGNGIGGSIDIVAAGATLRIGPVGTIVTAISANAGGTGGNGGNGLSIGGGGDGTGGLVYIAATANPAAANRPGALETGNLLVVTNGAGGSGNTAGTGFGNSAQLFAVGGTIAVTGTAGFSATGIGGLGVSSIGGIGIGGSMALTGAITASGQIALDASSIGGSGDRGGGAGTGGFITASGQMNLAGGLLAIADAVGGNALIDGNGGSADAGRIFVDASGTDTLAIGQLTDLRANANGGRGESGGFAQSGRVELSARAATATLELGRLTIGTQAIGGTAGHLPVVGLARGGAASGAAVAITSNGSVRIADDVTINAARFGGTFAGSGTGDGGLATGGLFNFEASGSGAVLDIGGTFALNGASIGGSVDSVAVGNGGAAIGTNVRMINGGQTRLQLGGGGANIVLLTTGGNGSNSNGGTATGGTLRAAVDGTLDIGGSGLTIGVDATGGLGATGGIATGGEVILGVGGIGGSLTVAGNTSISATSFGGSGGGGNATGGLVAISTQGGSVPGSLRLSAAGQVAITADARGGRGSDGVDGSNGGTALGGNIALGSDRNGGTVAIGTLTATATGFGGTGGNSVVAGAGGNANGGVIFVRMGLLGAGSNDLSTVPGVFTLAGATLTANGNGGTAGAGTPALHGNGRGGTLDLSLIGANGTIAGDLTLVATGNAGGFGTPGLPATGFGGVANLSASATTGGLSSRLTVGGNTQLQAAGNGSGAVGSNGEPGVVRVVALGGSEIAMGPLSASATGSVAPPAGAIRSGLVADAGSTISIAGNGQFTSRGNVAVNDGGTITSSGTLRISAAGTLTSGFAGPTPGPRGVVAAQTLILNSQAGIDLVTQTTGSRDVQILGSPAAVTLRDISAVRDVTIAGGTVVLGNLRAGGTAIVQAATALTSGNISAGGQIRLFSDGGITAGSIDLGIVNPLPTGPFELYIRALNDISVADIRSVSQIGVLAGGSISIGNGGPSGNIASGGALVMLAGNNITANTLTAPTTGALFIGAFPQRSLISFPGGIADYTALLAASAVAAPGNVLLGSVTAGTAKIAAGDVLRVTGNHGTSGSAQLAGRDTRLATVVSGGDLDVATGDLAITSARAAGAMRLIAGNTVTAGALSGGNRIAVSAGDGVTLGNLDAGIVAPVFGAVGDVLVQAGSVALIGNVRAASNLALIAQGNLTSGSISSAGTTALLSSGSVSTGAITIGSSGSLRIGLANTASQRDPLAPDYAALLAGAAQPVGGGITVSGALTVPGRAELSAAGAIGVTGVINAGLLTVNSGGMVQFDQAVTSSDDVLITSAADANLGEITAAGEVRVAAGNTVRTGNVQVGDRISLESTNGAVTAGALSAAQASPQAGARGDVYVRGQTVAVGAVAAASDIGLLSSGTLSSAALRSGRDLVLLSGGTITTAAITTPATGRVRFGNIGQASVISFNAGVPNYSALFTAPLGQVAGDIDVRGALTTGLLEASTSGRFLDQSAIVVSNGARISAQGIGLTDVTSGGFIEILSTTDLLLGNLTSATGLTLSTQGNITTGNLAVGGTLSLSALQSVGGGGALVTGNIRSSDDIRLNAVTTITTGSLSAADSVFVTAGGTIVTGNIDAGTVAPAQRASGVVFITSPGTITTGNINISGSATLSGVLGVTSGNISAPQGIVLLDTGGINAGALTTSANGFVYISSHELLPLISFDQAGNLQFATLLARTPTRLIGDIRISGAASTGRFLAAATGGFDARAITAPTSVSIDIGGTVNLAASVTSSRVAITSSDIVIAPGSIIGGGGAAEISLAANGQTAVTSAAIGGGDVAGNYSLSNAEFGTLRAASINVRLPNGTMTIGQLNLPATVPGAITRQQEGQGQSGPVQVQGPDLPTSISLSSGGLIRVNGAVTMAQATAANSLTLTAGSRLEVETTAGRIQLGNNAELPAGTLNLNGASVRVASNGLLAQIAAGTLAGKPRIDALNAISADPALAGQIIAGAIRINAAQDVLIQNSGSAATRAGFTAGSGGLTVTATGTQAGALDMVINGRVLRDAGFVINDDTRAAVIVQPSLDILTDTAQVNGCPQLTGCAPPPAAQRRVDVIVNNVAALTPTQEQQREDAKKAVEKLPIILLQRLIDFSPMFADPDTSDPAASGGNPSLWLDPLPGGVRRPGGLK
ncbi:hypothetical protein [Sandarakinorhabdus sp.]|uniref:hypothetical protein n=1 Tax=Sandarakinorhabdus sp. TaxID=1916663 RepID=UPI003341484B